MNKNQNKVQNTEPAQLPPLQQLWLCSQQYACWYEPHIRVLIHTYVDNNKMKHF